MESERRREELRSKAQEAVRQWKNKCKRRERELQELKEESRNNTDKEKQVRLHNPLKGYKKKKLFATLSIRDAQYEYFGRYR